MSALPHGLEGKRVALVHEWLVDYSGSERVFEQLIEMFPDADLFSVVDFLPESLRWFIKNKPVKTTFIQNLPRAQKSYRSYLPLMPLAVEQHDLSGYDLVISSAHAVSKGVLTGPRQLHISYVHSPMRYAWDLQHQYLRESGLDRGLKGWAAKWFLHKLRLWDLRTANGVDCFVANSRFIGKRIAKTYRRESDVVYPAVDIEGFAYVDRKEDFYVTASRFVPYKRVDIIVEAFAAMPDRKLVVIGDGPDNDKVRAKAGPNVSFLGYAPKAELRDHLQRAKAFVFAAEEDFGIVPVEAQACGTPVIAFGRGGALETVNGLDTTAPTGVFFDEQSAASIRLAVDAFESNSARILSVACRANAERFGAIRFRAEMATIIEREWRQFAGGEPRAG